jgi:hypothetical protein
MNETQKRALETLFRSSSAVTTCRNLLAGRLFSVGLQLTRNGEPIELTPAFQRHLNTVWLDFARGVLDSFLIWGMAVVVLEEPLEATLFGRTQSKKRPREPLVPIVPPPDTYDVSFMVGGRMGYLRSYKVYSAAPHHATEADPEAHVFVCEPPTPEGDFCSPTASVFGLASFVDSIQDLAMQAELVNTRPRVFAQPRKEDTGKGISDSSLFFDSMSRNLQQDQDGDDSKAKASLMAMQVRLCEAINNVQTRGANCRPTDVTLLELCRTLDICKSCNPKFTRRGSSRVLTRFGSNCLLCRAGAQHDHVKFGKLPETPAKLEVTPGIFTLPVGLDLVNNSTGLANPRGDLENLVRLANESAAAAFGVPLEMLSGGSFRASSNQQLMLLNSTITTWTRCVDNVLAAAYNAIYADDAEISLIVNPLVATEEIINLNAASLMPRAMAMAAALGDVASAAAVKQAIGDAEKEEAEKKAAEEEKAKVDLEGAKVGVEKQRADIAATKSNAAAATSSGAASIPGSP